MNDAARIDWLAAYLPRFIPVFDSGGDEIGLEFCHPQGTPEYTVHRVHGATLREAIDAGMKITGDAR